MYTNNVITFPKSYSGPKDSRLDLTAEEVSKNIDTMKQFHIQETLMNVIPIIFNHLEVSGFAFPENEDDKESIKDGAMIVESLRSFMSKYYEIYHPFQKLAENIFESDKEDTESLNIVDSLNIKLKEEV
jgi:hypothetical protein